ncbi:DUF3152 domain-containing protein [Streptomyces sp. NPDC004647]|uniref:DUF3152 domain-containing protein n=1 Tax=Streptomyces sp. NPDC004647 TaxID=3154671 RepID=UPI0033B68FFE
MNQDQDPDPLGDPGHSDSSTTGTHRRPPPVTPPHGVPRPRSARGGHPEHREAGGAWGVPPPSAAPAQARAAAPAAQTPVQGVPVYGGNPRRATGPQGAAQQFGRTAVAAPVRPSREQAGAFLPRPRQEYVDAFDEGVYPAGAPTARTAAEETDARPSAAPGGDGEPPAGDQETAAHGKDGKSGKGRAFGGVAAAAVTTVLAVVVAGQVVGHGRDSGASQSANEVTRKDTDDASRSDDRPTPERPPAVTASYEERMAAKYPLDVALAGSGDFKPVAGRDSAPGKGEVVRYRVDVEKGLPLDGELFAQAVHKTLNDERSWGHGGTRTFERVSGRKADWVITLASPGTTAVWCAKSGLDTTEDNVSCDAASTQRIMINAYRWAQGAETYGDKMFSYREMLINHEVGHRLGRNHEECEEQGALAPVMMQQTKFLATDGVICKPNAWPFPGSR